PDLDTGDHDSRVGGDARHVGELRPNVVASLAARLARDELVDHEPRPSEDDRHDADLGGPADFGHDPGPKPRSTLARRGSTNWPLIEAKGDPSKSCQHPRAARKGVRTERAPASQTC